MGWESLSGPEVGQPGGTQSHCQEPEGTRGRATGKDPGSLSLSWTQTKISSTPGYLHRGTLLHLTTGKVRFREAALSAHGFA